MVLIFIVISVNIGNFSWCLLKSYKIIFFILSLIFGRMFFISTFYDLRTFTVFELKVDNTCWLVVLLTWIVKLMSVIVFGRGIFIVHHFTTSHILFIAIEYIFTVRVDYQEITILIFLYLVVILDLLLDLPSIHLFYQKTYCFFYL